jgi:histidyl-tRNA synthetase
LSADLEIIMMAIELMKAFGASSNQFVLYLNHRHMVDSFLLSVLKLDASQKQGVIRTMDKWYKLPEEKFVTLLEVHELATDQIEMIVRFLQAEQMADMAAFFGEDMITGEYAWVSELYGLIEQLTSL